MTPVYTIKRLQDTRRALRIARELRSRERWSRDDLLAFQARALTALLQHSVSRSPFYRERYGPAGADANLTDLPVLTKATVMEHFDGLVTDTRLTLSGLERHIDHLNHDEYYLDRYRVMVTSGTVGLRGVFVYDRPAWSTAVASALRTASLIGFGPRFPRRLRWAFIGAPSPVHMSNRLPASADVGLYNMLRLDATRPINELVSALNEFQPEILQAYPSVAAVLAVEQQEGRLRLGPRVVTTTAEMRTPQMEERIHDAWGARPYSLYGMTEIGIVGSDCPQHRGIHLSEDLAIYEAVDGANRPVPPGSPSHKLLVTNLFNYTQPLIRYEVSDMVTMAPEPCPCGRPLALVSAIEGRNDDMLVLHGPDGRRVPVHPIHIHSPLTKHSKVRQYQVVLDENGLHVLVVPTSGVSDGECSAGIADDLRRSLSKLPVLLPPIEVRVVESISREGGQAAKLKLIRSLVTAD